jgi:hypothetical protein
MVSYILAAIILVPTVLVAAVVAFGRHWQGGPYKRVAATLAVLAAGSAFAWLAFSINRGMEVTTLHEVMLEGTLDLKEGERVPVRETSFGVEHPGVEHELFFSPSGGMGGREDFQAEVAVQLLDPAGEVVLEDRHTFVPERGSRRFDPLRWPGRKLPFRPEQEGTYRLRVVPLTIGVKGIHVRIADPEKRDGHRMPGY